MIRPESLPLDDNIFPIPRNAFKFDGKKCPVCGQAVIHSLVHPNCQEYYIDTYWQGRVRCIAYGCDKIVEACYNSRGNLFITSYCDQHSSKMIPAMVATIDQKAKLAKDRQIEINKRTKFISRQQQTNGELLFKLETELQPLKQENRVLKSVLAAAQERAAEAELKLHQLQLQLQELQKQKPTCGPSPTRKKIKVVKRRKNEDDDLDVYMREAHQKHYRSHDY